MKNDIKPESEFLGIPKDPKQDTDICLLEVSELRRKEEEEKESNLLSLHNEYESSLPDLSDIHPDYLYL